MTTEARERLVKAIGAVMQRHVSQHPSELLDAILTDYDDLAALVDPAEFGKRWTLRQMIEAQNACLVAQSLRVADQPNGADAPTERKES